MDLKELGQLLQGQREALGYSIEDLSEKTRISRRILSVFEVGEVDEYPHPVYAKGFIRNYAKALSLDEEMCIRALEKVLAPDEDVDEDGEPKLSLNDLDDPRPAIKSGSSWLVLLGCASLVGVLAALVWYFSFSGLSGDVVKPSKEQSLNTEQSEVVEHAEAQPATAADTMVAETAEQEATATSSEENKPLSVQASAGQAGQQVPVTKETVATPASQSEKHALFIEVTGKKPCWVGVWIPGQEDIAKDFTVPVGERVEYRFTGDRILRFGRVETVKLIFDGKPRPVKGKGVVNLTLP